MITFKVSRGSKFRLLWMIKLLLVIGYFCSFAHSWRITQKCPHGHYYNDGCTACWCDIRTGHTKCEKLLKCTRVVHPGQVQCPHGRQFKDSCGNDCTCFESSGTVLCNEFRKCPQESPVLVDLSPLASPVASNVLTRRSGIAAPYPPPVEEHPIRFDFPGTTALPPIRSSTFNPTPTSRNYEFYQNDIAIASTPHPHIRIPSRSSGRSEELIIEPAIIIRKKGSNKASIVRNPSSATSVTLPSSRRRNQGPAILINKSDNKASSSYHTAKSAPLQLYEKQLQTIMNIRRAYNQILRAKVNFNFQLAAGKNPLNTVPANQYSNVASSTDHPRRFDLNIDDNTATATTPAPPIFRTSQQPTAPSNIQVKPFQPFVWRNVLKQFSPVPPLKHMVSYVTSTTENYLKDFLNRNRLQVQQPIQTQSSPQETPLHAQMSTPPPTTPRPPSLVSYPFNPFSTIEPFHEQQHDPSTIPIHEVYQNHNFKMMSTPSTPQPSYHSHNSYLHTTLSNPTYQPNNFGVHEQGYKKEHFPYMNDLMHEIARMDSMPSTTPRYSPTFTALPTFQTPGPPYAEIEEVQPLSFLPPPQPEPATPTRRTFMMGEEGKHPPPLVHKPYLPVHIHPTVRVNLDKPIYINQPTQPTFSQQSQNSYPQQYQHSFPQQSHHSYPQQHQHSQSRFPPPYQSFPPPQNNRKIYSIPPRPPAHSPIQQYRPLYSSQSAQRHHHVQQHNLHNRPSFPQYFIPKPKQYRLVLKGPVREAAVRVDDVVPRFVNKIAHEFFKKPEIYVPKIRPGKPLTLERVVLNHKEIVPSEMNFSPTPGSSATKLRFTPQAHWDMKEDMAKQGIIFNEPLPVGVSDHVSHDPNVMEMDAPVKAVQTWETHASMGMGAIADHSPGQNSANILPAPASIPQIIQQTAPQQQQQQLQYNPILLPSPSPPQVTVPPATLDHQHQQEIQHQIILAQQQLQQHYQQQQQIASSSSGSSNDNDFKFDPGDFNDFRQDENSHHIFPHELQIPGVEQVVVDKYLVHDPLDPAGTLQIYSTTTVQPPVVPDTKMDVSSQLRRNGFTSLQVSDPTSAPAVLVRHHGAPSPSTPLLPTDAPVSPSSLYSANNYLVTVINTTPQPFVAHTVSPIENSPTQPISNVYAGVTAPSTNTNLASQIHDFLAEQMDFGARPQLNFYDTLLHHRTGEDVVHEHNDENKENQHVRADIDSEANADKDALKHDEYFRHSHTGMDDLIATESKISGEDPSNMDTDSVAKIFSMDYKNKYNRKPPAVIVIKVPPEHSDGPFPKVIEKRRGEEIEIQGGHLNSKGRAKTEKLTTRKNNNDNDDTSTESGVITSLPTTQKYTTSLESVKEDEDNDSITSSTEESPSAKRRRDRKNRKRKRRRRKKKNNKNRNSFAKDNEERNEESDNENVKSQEITTSEHKSENKDKKYKTSSRENDSEIDETLSIPEKPPEEVVAGAEEKFQAELDWKSQLMANICDLNPSSPLCLTYRSICLLMTSTDD